MTGGRHRRWARRVGQAASLLALLGFGVFVARELRDGFARRGADPGATEAAEEPEDVESLALETTAFDSDGTRIEIRAREALGRSDGRQRLLEAEVRLVGADQGRDVRLAADELVLDVASDVESLDFIGNALLETPRIQLSGPHLRFRGSPNRLWSIDPVQFVTEDFVGMAASVQFRVDTGDVHLRGVTADPPPAASGGARVAAGRARFDPADGATTLVEAVELTSGRLELHSDSPVVVRRDLALGRTRAIEAGFASELVVRPPPGPPGDETATEETPPITLSSDFVEIELGPDGAPTTVRLPEGVQLARGHTDLRAGRGRLALAPDGSPERLDLGGGVEARLEAGLAGVARRLVFVESESMEAEIEPDGELGVALFEGGVETRVGEATATSDTAHWNGANTFRLEGSPRLEDPSLLELESTRMRLTAGSASRVRADGRVAVRFAASELDWLPGAVEEAGLIAERADFAAGSGRARFFEDVRLRFGPNRVISGALTVDAAAGKLVAMEGVRSDLEFATPPREDESGGASEPDRFAFTATANLMAYEAGTARLSWRGGPQLEHRGPGEVTKLVADRLDAALTPGGAASSVTGSGEAGFDRGDSRIEGDRIRYSPGPDVLEAWGAPATVDSDGRRSEGGWLEVGLSDARSRIRPSDRSRTETRVVVRRTRPQGDSGTRGEPGTRR